MIPQPKVIGQVASPPIIVVCLYWWNKSAKCSSRFSEPVGSLHVLVDWWDRCMSSEFAIELYHLVCSIFGVMEIDICLPFHEGSGMNHTVCYRSHLLRGSCFLLMTCGMDWFRFLEGFCVIQYSFDYTLFPLYWYYAGYWMNRLNWSHLELALSVPWMVASHLSVLGRMSVIIHVRFGWVSSR